MKLDLAAGKCFSQSCFSPTGFIGKLAQEKLRIFQAANLFLALLLRNAFFNFAVVEEDVAQIVQIPKVRAT